MPEGVGRGTEGQLSHGGVLRGVGGVCKTPPTVFGAREDDGQLRVEADAGHVLGVTLQGLNAGFVLVDENAQRH